LNNLTWQTPKQLNKILSYQAYQVDRVFNFVFADRPAFGIVIDVYECAVYNHSIKEIPHVFYGTNAVVERLSTLDGFADGRVCFVGPSIHSSYS